MSQPKNTFLENSEPYIRDFQELSEVNETVHELLSENINTDYRCAMCQNTVSFAEINYDGLCLDCAEAYR